MEAGEEGEGGGGGVGGDGSGGVPHGGGEPYARGHESASASGPAPPGGLQSKARQRWLNVRAAVALSTLGKGRRREFLLNPDLEDSIAVKKEKHIATRRRRRSSVGADALGLSELGISTDEDFEGSKAAQHYPGIRRPPSSDGIRRPPSSDGSDESALQLQGTGMQPAESGLDDAEPELELAPISVEYDELLTIEEEDEDATWSDGEEEGGEGQLSEGLKLLAAVAEAERGKQREIDELKDQAALAESHYAGQASALQSEQDEREARRQQQIRALEAAIDGDKETPDNEPLAYPPLKDYDASTGPPSGRSFAPLLGAGSPPLAGRGRQSLSVLQDISEDAPEAPQAAADPRMAWKKSIKASTDVGEAELPSAEASPKLLGRRSGAQSAGSFRKAPETGSFRKPADPRMAWKKNIKLSTDLSGEESPSDDSPGGKSWRKSGFGNTWNKSRLKKRTDPLATFSTKISNIKTPGFILLLNLTKLTHPDIVAQATAFDDQCKDYYKDIKKRRHKQAKKGPMGHLTGKLKRRYELTIKFRAAVEAIMAAQSEAGPDLLKQVRRVVQAKTILDESPELRALIDLQAQFRRVSPVLDVHRDLPRLRKQENVRRTVSAHKLLVTVAKARVQSDQWFLHRSSLREKVWLYRQRSDARGDLRQVLNFHVPYVFPPAELLVFGARRALLNKSWEAYVSSAIAVTRFAKAIIIRRKYCEMPAMSGVVISFYPNAKATTMLGSHLCRCAREHLSLGNFRRASMLLEEAEQQVLLAEARLHRDRSAWAQSTVARAALRFHRKRMTRAARLKVQLRDAEKIVEESKAKGIRGRQLQIQKDSVNLLRQQARDAVIKRDQEELARQTRGHAAGWKRFRDLGGIRALLQRRKDWSKTRSIVLWTSEQVVEWLQFSNHEGVVLAALQKVFADNKIDGRRLIKMTNLDLLGLGLSPKDALDIEHEARRELDAAIARTNDMPPATSDSEDDEDDDEGMEIDDGEVGETGGSGNVRAGAEAGLEEGTPAAEGTGQGGSPAKEPAGRDEKPRAPLPEGVGRERVKLPQIKSHGTGSDGQTAGAARPPASGGSRSGTKGVSRPGSKPARDLEREEEMRKRYRREPSPRAWAFSVEPQGARVQQAVDVEFGEIPMKTNEEIQAKHSFEEIGCLCQHNWICPRCFVWNRAETRYDASECIWCEGPRPYGETYHPKTWEGASEFGVDRECPVMLAVLRKEEAAAGKPSSPETKLPAIKRPKPRDSYPDYALHPQIATGRPAGDARRVEEEWQVAEIGISNAGPVDIARHDFQDEDLDVKDRGGALVHHELAPSAAFDWNPVARFVPVKKGPGSKELAARLTLRRPISGHRARQLQVRRIGIRKSDFF